MKILCVILSLLMTSVCLADDDKLYATGAITKGTGGSITYNNYVDPVLIKDQCDFEKNSHVPRTAFYKKFCMDGNLKEFFDAKDFETDHHMLEHISIRQGDQEVLYVGGIDDYKGIISDKYNVKVSCPEGYKLQIRSTPEPWDRVVINGMNVRKPDYTEAELKCVKEIK